MIKRVAIIIACLLLVLGSSMLTASCSSPELSTAARTPQPTARINNDQPIPIGETICTAGLDSTPWYLYIYQGLDDKNNMKVLYKAPSLGETTLLSLPLNDRNQAFLRVKMPNGLKKDLLISVADEFKRIVVEEYSPPSTN